MAKRKTTTKKYKLDIFQVLDRINQNDRFYYRNLSDDDKKELQFLVIMRWLSGTRVPLQIELLNHIVNPVVFEKTFRQHPELLWFLLTICRGKTRYQWMKKKPKIILPIPIEIIKRHYGYNTKEATEVLPIFTNDDIIKMAEDLGIGDDEFKTLKKDLKKR